MKNWWMGLMVAVMLGAVPVAAGAGECSEPVRTREGRVTGGAGKDAAVCQWLGLPYAAPPTGWRRFRPPEPAPARYETLAATRFGRQCMQPRQGLTALLPSMPESEDCLYLNVWRPMKSGSFPVMVWIHGGDLLTGSGASEYHLGDRLAAEQDVVVVAINYRLGPFGFLYHPALAAEDPHESSGNYGLMDQAAALRWVRDNIAAFGGDPDNVTIFGESAGGWSVCHLLASPLASGLFHRAIIESGGCQCSRTVEQGRAYGLEFAARLKCPAEGQAAAECLRGKSAKQIIAAMGRDWQEMLGHFFPHVDGYALKASPLDALRSGDYNRVPLIVGSTRDEFKLFASEIPGGRLLPASRIDRTIAEYMRADLNPTIGALYPPSSHPRPADAMLEAIGDAYMGCPNWRAAAASAGHEPKTFHYRFDFDDHLAPDMIGAAHGTELAFIFDAGDRTPANLLYTGKKWRAAKPLGLMMRSYWANFAAAGDPNGPGLPVWPAYTPAGRERMLLDLPPQADVADLEEKCAYWDRQPIVIH